MPIHDWSRAAAGIFHHFNGTWLFELAAILNEEILPPGFYALGEQALSGAVPNVLTLERRGETSAASDIPNSIQEPILAEPAASLTAVAQEPRYPPRPRVLAIRHISGDRVIAILEIVSPGNKKDAAELGALVEKTMASLSKGVHVVLIDLHPPGSFDPQGLHNVIWEELGQESTRFSPGRPLQVVSYAAGKSIRAFIEPLAVEQELPDIPLFLSARKHVLVPLERAYRTAFARLPKHLQASLR